VTRCWARQAPGLLQTPFSRRSCLKSTSWPLERVLKRRTPVRSSRDSESTPCVMKALPHQKRREAPAFMPGMDRRWARRAQCPRAQQDLRSTRALNGRGHCIGGSPGIHAGEDVPVFAMLVPSLPRASTPEDSEWPCQCALQASWCCLGASECGRTRAFVRHQGKAGRCCPVVDRGLEGSPTRLSRDAADERCLFLLSTGAQPPLCPTLIWQRPRTMKLWSSIPLSQ